VSGRSHLSHMEIRVRQIFLIRISFSLFKNRDYLMIQFTCNIDKRITFYCNLNILEKKTPSKWLILIGLGFLTLRQLTISLLLQLLLNFQKIFLVQPQSLLTIRWWSLEASVTTKSQILTSSSSTSTITMCPLFPQFLKACPLDKKVICCRKVIFKVLNIWYLLSSFSLKPTLRY